MDYRILGKQDYKNKYLVTWDWSQSSTQRADRSKSDWWVANSEGPNQTPRSVLSDIYTVWLGMSLLRLTTVCWKRYGYFSSMCIITETVVISFFILSVFGKFINLYVCNSSEFKKQLHHKEESNYALHKISFEQQMSENLVLNFDDYHYILKRILYSQASLYRYSTQRQNSL